MHANETRLRALWQGLERGQEAAVRQQARAWRASGTAPPALDLLLAALALAEARPGEAAALYGGLAGGEWDAPARVGRATALSRLGDAAGAEQVLAELVARSPGQFLAQLHWAELLEARGEHAAAAARYYAAVVQAQRQGRWLDAATTAPGLRARVTHAMARIEEGRRTLFLELLAPLRQRHGRDALARVERGLMIYLGELPAQYATPQQRPTFFYVPGVPAAPYPSRTLFPWLEQLEQATDGIREEMQATRARAEAYAPFLGAAAEALPPGLIAGDGTRPAWDAYFFYRHGVRDESHARECPLTAAALERTPLVRIREHAPEICFSVLAPGTHILPHRGVTNTRLTVHLPLVVPGQCALRAGGELHEWQEGRVLVFDDSFEHEAWNRSTESRTILLMDTWNPHLDLPEREAIEHLVAGIGDFNRAVALP